MDSNFEGQSLEENGVLGWGKSLPAPSVQEMVRNDSKFVPERYIQDRKDRPFDSSVCFESSEIPIVDLSLLIDGDEYELNKLDFACKEWGFFQIINHGMTEEILHNMKASVAAFFALPLEEKKKYSMPENDLQGEAVEKYSKELERVTEEIMANLSLLMGMDKNGLKRLHFVSKQSMRMNYYPPCSSPELVVGISPHSDCGSITILLQDDDTNGLQIKHDGGWVPVKPIPNALVVNVADVVEAWSNGVYKSIEHRAVTNANKARMSIATFVMPHEEIELGPIESMVKGRQKLYKHIKYYDYIRHVLERKMDGKAHTDFLKLESE